MSKLSSEDLKLKLNLSYRYATKNYVWLRPYNEDILWT